jgi:hypothetical protein
MPHNFRLTGGMYIAKSGIDTNNGTSPNTPKQTFSGGLIAAYGSGNTYATVIGSGTYEEAFNPGLSWKPNANAPIVADGIVVVRGTGNLTQSFTFTRQSGGAGAAFSGFRFENYATFSTQGSNFTNCLFKDITNFSISFNTSGTPFVSNSIFVNCTNVILNSQQAVNCLFINCNVTGTGAFTNNYLNGASRLTLGTGGGGINNNNIMCPIVYQGVTYPTLADQQAALTTTNINSINAAPLFNNAAQLDFTLQYNSPHIGLNIGPYGYARPSVMSIDPEWQQVNGALWDGVTTQGQDIVTAPGITTGTITSAPIKVSANPVELTAIYYNGLLLFNKSQAGGSVTNNNVPDASLYPNTGADAGATPDRLSYEMRWTDVDVQPASAVDYLNGYLNAAGTWTKFEWNTKPLVDGNGIGNGNPAYNTSVAYPVSAIWVQIRITLTNAYV